MLVVPLAPSWLWTRENLLADRAHINHCVAYYLRGISQPSFRDVMNFLRKWWRGKDEEPAPASSEEDDQNHTQWHQQHRAARRAAAAAAVAARCPPLITEAQGRAGGIQGLDWFQHSMLRDSDGDCAHCFLEEPSRQQRQQERDKEQQQGRPSTSTGSSGSSPMPEQEKVAMLQNCSQRAQAAGPSDMLLDKGNVYVVPHDL